MKLDLSNPKHRLVFLIVSLVLAAVIFTIIGYFGAKNVFEAQNELAPSPTPTASTSPTVTATSTKTTSEIEKLRQEKANLQKELDDANSEIDSQNAGFATINAYNNFLEYMTQVIDAHDGFSGWTDAEYQIGKEKAEATGNNDFVGIVDTAWNDKTIDVTTRVINVYRAIVSGISGAIQ